MCTFCIKIKIFKCISYNVCVKQMLWSHVGKIQRFLSCGLNLFGFIKFWKNCKQEIWMKW